jgi:hypothetical protein
MMTLTLDVLLYLLAAVCVFLAAVGVNPSRVGLGWLGLFFFILTFLTP